MTQPKTFPWYLYPILLRPRQIADNLERVRAAGIVAPDDVPNLWQIALGVMRMWHRIAFRPESIGLARDARVRPTLRAKLLANRLLRFPFVLREGSVVPGDLSGLGSTAERLITHIVGTYHDGVQFVYDYQILETVPGGPEELLRRTRDIATSDTPRTRFIKDLAVFEGYHERLLSWVEDAIANGTVAIPADQTDDPEISFHAYLRWCARQPATPAETIAAVREGRFRFPEGSARAAAGAAARAA